MKVQYVVKGNSMIVKAVSRGAADFARSLRAAVYGLWKGELDELAFLDTFYASVRRGLTNAWHEGASDVGIESDELTIAERNELNFQIANNTLYLADFAAAILRNPRGVGKLSPLMKRLELWVNQYNNVRNLARTMASADAKLEWVYGDTQHCSTCLVLHGKVKRASQWRESGIRPQNPPNPALECEGWRCQCQLVPTEKHLTPGTLPMLV